MVALPEVRTEAVTSPDGRYSFNSPPTWPPPPQGWTPVAGWRPDPAWPPAPKGWQFWTPLDPTVDAPVTSYNDVFSTPAADGSATTAAAVPEQRELDVYTDLDKMDLRPTLNRQLAKARKRHNDEVLALRKQQIRNRGARPAPPTPANGSAPQDEQPAAMVATSEMSPAAGSGRSRPSFADKRAERDTARQAKQAVKQADRDAAAAVQARQDLLAQRTSLQEQLDFVSGWPQNAPASAGLVMKKGEHLVGTVQPAGLVEVRRARGHVVGASSGVSVRVAKGVRLRAGAACGHYVPGDEQETQIDTGSAAITNQRIVFSGSRQTREWKFENLTGRQLTGNRQMSWIELPVTNRQKTSALSFPKGKEDAVVSAIELALLFYQGEQAGLIDSLREQLAELKD